MPYALAAMGGVLSERSGVTNIALEGILLMGAFGAAIGAYDAGDSIVVAVSYGIGARRPDRRALRARRHHVPRRSDRVRRRDQHARVRAHAATCSRCSTSSTSNSPVIEGFGGNLFANPVFWLALLLAPAVPCPGQPHAVGLRVRAVGEHPEAAHTLGVSVTAIRWQAVLGSGVLAGLGGAWLSLSGSGFVSGMSAGRGYIALAAVIMGSWRPLWACAASLLFGFAEAIQVNLQTFQIGLPNEIVQAFPYVLTMITLAGFIGRSRTPAALGRPYEPR